MPPLSHLNFCTSNKSYLYLTNSLGTDVSDLDLYWLLTLHVPNLMPLFHCLRRVAKESFQVRGLVKCVIALWSLSIEDLFSTSPNHDTRGPSICGFPRLLIQYIRSYSPCWRPFLHPQPEDEPFRADRDPLIAEPSLTYSKTLACWDRGHSVENNTQGRT